MIYQKKMLKLMANSITFKYESVKDSNTQIKFYIFFKDVKNHITLKGSYADTLPPSVSVL